MGIEPTSEAWEASILPLYDARFALTPAKNIIALGQRATGRSRSAHVPTACRSYLLGDSDEAAVEGDGCEVRAARQFAVEPARSLARERR